MTDVFEKFIKQYNSIGSQKSDGYDKSFFDGMTDLEKEKAFEMLVQELIAPGVIEWLYYLDLAKTKKSLINYISNLKKNEMDGVHRLYAFMFKQTGDKKYQDLLIDNYPNYPDREKRQAIWLIHASKPERAKEIALYIGIIKSSIRTKGLSTAADFFLRINGFTLDTEEEKKEFYRLRKDLESSDPALKEIAINNIIMRE